MTKNDMEHRLLMGGPLYLEEIPTYRITLGDMADFSFGYDCCQQLIGLLCLNETSLPRLPHSQRNLRPWEFLTARLYAEYDKQNHEAADSFGSSLSLLHSLPPFFEMLFHQKTIFHFEKACFLIGSKNSPFQLDSKNYPILQEILQSRNCFNGQLSSEPEENPGSEMAKMLLKKRRMLREKVKQLKGEGDSGNELTMHDLISIFAEAQKMTPEFVYRNYDVYQFNNQFNRLKIMEDYQVNIRALLAGAKSEELQLKHWLTKIN